MTELNILPTRRLVRSTMRVTFVIATLLGGRADAAAPQDVCVAPTSAADTSDGIIYMTTSAGTRSESLAINSDARWARNLAIERELAAARALEAAEAEMRAAEQMRAKAEHPTPFPIALGRERSLQLLALQSAPLPSG